ncbi:carbon monoxide dehydrogenase subunit G [Tardiphaga sp.]|uniref:SRPBCC family protein n=1 Tax=Tardiphaga sp. TaxID=1926292 RepID=UPI00352B3E02
MAILISGEYKLPIGQDAVYAALNDPEILRKCIPGCEELEQREDGIFAAIVRLELGPLKTRFRGKVKLEDQDPPNGYRISGEGDGGIAGFAKGGAFVRLTADEDGGTKLVYEADANINGKIAQLGQRLITNTSKKIADRFFENLLATLQANAA